MTIAEWTGLGALGLGLLGAQRVQISQLFTMHSKLADERHQTADARAKSLEERLDETDGFVQELRTEVQVIKKTCQILHPGEAMHVHRQKA